MGIYRLYTGGDGQSHVQELDLAAHPNLQVLQPVSGVMFREWPPGYSMDWHPAPLRQYVISLSGQIEIGLGDGTKRRFGPGDARLVEDTTGQGHTTRVVSNQPSICVVIPLAD